MKKAYKGIIKYKDGSEGNFNMTIRGLSKMLQKENYKTVIISEQYWVK